MRRLENQIPNRLFFEEALDTNKQPLVYLVRTMAKARAIGLPMGVILMQMLL